MKLRILLIFFIAFIFTSCTDSGEILRVTNVLYLDIKTVVTDPDILPGISAETLDRLAAVERAYLGAAAKLREVGRDDTVELAHIVDCGDEILNIIDTLVLGGKYEKEISAIRLSIKILKNHLYLE